MEWICAGLIVLIANCYDSLWFWPLCLLAMVAAYLA